MSTPSPSPSQDSCFDIPTILELQSSPSSSCSSSTLILIHPGSGISSMYARLTFPSNLRVLAISNTFLAKGIHLKSIEEIANYYIDLLSTWIHSKETKLVLGGWSFGGVISIQMAKQYESQHQQPIQGVLLIDSIHPQGLYPSPSQLIESSYDYQNADRSILTGGSSSSLDSKLFQYLRKCYQQAELFLSQYQPTDSCFLGTTILIKAGKPSPFTRSSINTNLIRVNRIKKQIDSKNGWIKTLPSIQTLVLEKVSHDEMFFWFRVGIVTTVDG